MPTGKGGCEGILWKHVMQLWASACGDWQWMVRHITLSIELIVSICLEVYILDVIYNLKAFVFFCPLITYFICQFHWNAICAGWVNLEQRQRLTVANCPNIWKSDQHFVQRILVMQNTANWSVKKTWITTSLQSDQICKFSFWHCPLFTHCTLPSKTITNMASSICHTSPQPYPPKNSSLQILGIPPLVHGPEKDPPPPANRTFGHRYGLKAWPMKIWSPGVCTLEAAGGGCESTLKRRFPISLCIMENNSMVATTHEPMEKNQSNCT